MSRKPMRRARASVWTTVRPSSLTAEISATVSAAGSSPSGRLWNTGYVARRWNVSSGAGAVRTTGAVAAGAVGAAPAGGGTAAATGRPRASVAPATSATGRVRRAGRSGALPRVRSGIDDMALLRQGRAEGRAARRARVDVLPAVAWRAGELSELVAPSRPADCPGRRLGARST